MSKKLFLTLLFMGCCLFGAFDAYAAATLNKPVDSAACLDSRTAIEFGWKNTATGVESYKVLIYGRTCSDYQYSDYDLMVSEEFSLTQTSTSYFLYPSHQYKWKVITFYTPGSGKSPDTSETRTFFTADLPDIKLLNDSGEHCAYGEVQESLGVKAIFPLQWNHPYSELVKIEIAVDEEYGKSVSYIVSGINGEYDLQLPYDTTCTIRLRTVSFFDSECVGPWSDLLTVKMLKRPAAPEFSEYSIPDGSLCEPVTPMFKWQRIDTTRNTIRYYVEVSDDPSFENILNTFGSNADTVQGFVNKFRSTFFWRIFAVDELTGCISDYSDIRSFTTLPEPVVLRTPENNAKGAEAFKANSKNVIEFTWENKNDLEEGAYVYVIQVANSDNFSDTTIVECDTVSVETKCSYDFELNSDLYNKTLFWRVQTVLKESPSSEDGCASAWSEIRDFKTPYKTPTIVYPTETETCFNGSNPLKWIRTPEARGYEIYLSTDKNFADNKTQVYNINLGIDSMYIEFNLEHETKYYWKIRAIDTLNNSFFSDAAEFRTITMPTKLLDPSNGMGGVHSPIVFNWQAREEAFYTFQLALDEDFTKVVLDTNLKDPNIQLNLNANNQTYYWRVSVTLLNDILCPSEFTEPYFFVTNLAAPILESPKDNEELEVNEVILRWSEVGNATRYQLQISKDSTFTKNLEHIVKLVDNFYYKHSLDEISVYYWRVKALNDSTESAWSNYRSFKTGLESPSIPILIDPIRGLTKLPAQPTLVWNKCSNTKYYELEYSTDTNFANNNVLISGITDTAYTIEEPLDFYTTYYWHVRAVNDSLLVNDDDTTSIHYTVVSKWSDEWNFKTIKSMPEGKVELLSPLNGAADLIWDEIVLKWKSVDAADFYKLQVSESKEFDSFVINVSRIADTKYSTLRYLDTSHCYYWRVCAGNESGTTDWSDVWSFTTSELMSIYNTSVFEALELSPNPAYNNLNIKFNALRNMNASLHIVNTEGVEAAVISGNYSEGLNDVNINVSALSSGSYICYIMSEGKLIASTQFVIVK